MTKEHGLVVDEVTRSDACDCAGEQSATSLLPWEVESVAGSLSETVMSPPDAGTFAAADAPDWATPQQLSAAYALSLGLSNSEAAQLAGVSRTTLWRWLTHDHRGMEYKAFISRLTFLTGLARRSERLAMAKRMARHLYDKEMEEGQKRHTSLDWFRHVAELSGETEPVPVPLGARLAQQFIIGTQINVGALSRGLPDAASGVDERTNRPGEQAEGQKGD
jgi:hypothetical protein